MEETLTSNPIHAHKNISSSGVCTHSKRQPVPGYPRF